jgi:hypothetical protein
LQPDRAGPGQRGQEHALAGEQHALDAADRPHVHADPGMEGNHAAGVHVQPLARSQLALHHGAAGMHEHPAVASQSLHHETFAAEQAGEDLALEENAQLHAARAGEKGILLTDQAAAVVGQLHRHHGAGVGRGEGDLGLAGAGVSEHGGEQTLATDHSLAGGQQLVHQTATGAGRGAVAEHGIHLHRRVLVHQRAGFGDRAFAAVQFNLDELHVVADDAVVDRVRAVLRVQRRDAEKRRRRGWLIHGRLIAPQGRHRTNRLPFGHAFAPAPAVRLPPRLGHGGRVVQRSEPFAVGAVTEKPRCHVAASEGKVPV